MLGEDEYEQARSGALNNAMLMAGLQGLMASGPSLAPTSFGQILGQAGFAGLEGYGQGMQQAERSALQGMELRQQQQAQDRQNEFNQALQGVYTPNGQINYQAMQQLITRFPDLAAPAVQAIKSGVRPAPVGPKTSIMEIYDDQGRKVKALVNESTGEVIRTVGGAGGQQQDFKLDQPTLMMMQNVYGTTDFNQLTKDQQLSVNQFRNAPDAAKQAELTQAANQMRYETGIVIPVPKSRDEILIDLIRGSQAAPTTQQQTSPQTSTDVDSQADFPKAPTALQQKIDERFAPDYVEWTSGGGSDVISQLGQIKTVVNALESGQPLTGVDVAIQPDILLAITNPNALQSREMVESVVQRNLRIILGAQFTAQEGERLISRAYNPKLPPEQNAARLRNLFLQMSTAAEQKQAMVDYVNKNGTLRGYKGRMPTIDDFYNAINVGAPSTPKGAKPLTDIFR